MVPPLAAAYIGRQEGGRHVFVAGAYAGASGAVAVRPGPGLTGPARLILADTAGVRVAGDPGGAVVTRGRPPQAVVYRDPTRQANGEGSHIPCAMVDFDAEKGVRLLLQ